MIASATSINSLDMPNKRTPKKTIVMILNACHAQLSRCMMYFIENYFGNYKNAP